MCDLPAAIPMFLKHEKYTVGISSTVSHFLDNMHGAHLFAFQSMHLFLFFRWWQRIQSYHIVLSVKEAFLENITCKIHVKCLFKCMQITHHWTTNGVDKS
jgi:hypothetical protein